MSFVTTLVNPVQNSMLQTSGQNKVWLKLAKVFDGEQLRENIHVVYDAQSLLYVGQSAPVMAQELRQEQPYFIAEDLVLMPCLLEAHAHLHLLGRELNFDKRKQQQAKSTADLQLEAEERLRELAKFGLTAVRDGGDAQGIGLHITKQNNNGRPAYFSPGAGINRQKRYGSFFARPFEEFADAESCVANRIEQGAQHLKLVVSGIIDFQKGAVTAKPQFCADEIAQFAKFAHAKGLSVMAHASGEDGIRESVWGGVDTLEHGFFMQLEHLQEMAERRTVWIPTFAPVQCQVDYAQQMGWSAEIVGNLQRILDHHAQMLCKARELGVNIVAGSDAGSIGVPHGEGLLYELELMERAGLPTLEVLKSVTSNSAKHLFPKTTMGRIQTGSPARMMLVSSACLDSVANLKSPRTIIFDGCVGEAEEAQANLF
jgi:imidazolonepropionase-like amidohydrolase